ncbi:MAG: heterodisulfide reductase-related iron-sulfur binding cluster [Thaumarchaeota archaeon]|nr:heterodisulfide reductase-related iron-sulfur binding cluster [Nitrososphaerota archaeon]
MILASVTLPTSFLDTCVQTEVCRLKYPLLPSDTPNYLYSLFIIVLAIFLYGVYRKFSIYKIGRKEIFRNLPKLVKNGKRIIVDGLGQKKILQRRYGGVMHSWMFYGIIALTIGTLLVGIDYDILRPEGIVLLQGDFYLGYKTVLDIFGLGFAIAVVLALARRISFKPFFMGEDRSDRFLLVGMLYMGVSGFVQEGLRLALIPVPWVYFSPIGSIFANLFSSVGVGPSATSFQSWVNTYQTLWWIHAIVAFALIASIPYTKYFHVPNSIINMMLTDEERPLGRMSTPFNLAEIMKQQETNPDFVPDLTIGIKTSSDLKWDQRIMLDACTNCGRCEAACPANAAGRDLSPRLVVQDLKNRYYRDSKMKESQENEDLFSTGTIRDVEMYSCVTCAACVYECPVEINQVDFIEDLRRTIVSSNRLEPAQNTLLSNLASHQNPYGFSNSNRSNWTANVPDGVKIASENGGVEYLYWVGCIASFDQRAQNVARSLAKIMKHAGLSFSILGSEELCNGDPARRLGEEGRFQELALQNIEKLNGYGVKKIVTTCPHCFNTIKNEYPVFGGKYEVVHHTQLISELIEKGKIKISEGKLKDISVTLHDACYAVRYNSIFEEPRKILKNAEMDLREMPRCKEKTFCCGAGGSSYWYKIPQKKTITSIRTEEAAKTGAETLATECPFCLTMFEDSTKVTGTKLAVRDVAELVADELP